MADLDGRAESPAEPAEAGEAPTAIATESVEATVKIRALSSDGAGVGNLADGRVVFVQRTAPGDEVRVRGRQRHAFAGAFFCAARAWGVRVPV